jgi:hypothetical protein
VSCLSRGNYEPLIDYLLRLLSGGADSSISIWDLEQLIPAISDSTLRPKGTVIKYVIKA